MKIKRAYAPRLRWGLAFCVGCGCSPIDVGNMGRVKYVCRSYARRDPVKTQPLCDGGQGRPMWHSNWDAIQDWNSLQDEKRKEKRRKPKT